jgi:thiol-disulfide isomerase/thioredoxin
MALKVVDKKRHGIVFVDNLLHFLSVESPFTMSSFQNAAPGAKSMKFANALDPFAGFLGRESTLGAAAEDEPNIMTKQSDTRLRFHGGSSSASQGSCTVLQQQMSMSQQEQQVFSQESKISPASIADVTNREYASQSLTRHGDDDEDDSDFNSDDDDNDDAAIEAFRQKRLAEMKESQRQTDEHLAKGHGQVRIITQDEFLPQCTSSKFVVVHFFHKEFVRCQILTHHLKRIAPLHCQCKFVEIDAEKAPFFVVKLKIQTLPTLIVFRDGKAINRLIGFEDLAEGSNKNPDDFPTCSLGYWLERTGVIEYEGPNSDNEDNAKVSSSFTGRSKISRLSHYAVYDEDV